MLFLMVFLGMMVFMRTTAAQVATTSGGTEILDLEFGNTMENILETITSLGDAGRQYYLNRFLVVDCFYAIAYATFYFCTISILLQKNNIKKKALLVFCFFPIIGMCFDWLENLFLSILLTNHEAQLITVSRLYIISNVLKFIFVYASLVTVIINLLFCFVKKFFIQIKK